MIPLLRVMQRVCYHDYVVITYYYVIITKGPIITHNYIFQSPELADACPVNKRQSPKNGWTSHGNFYDLAHEHRVQRQQRWSKH